MYAPQWLALALGLCGASVLAQTSSLPTLPGYAACDAASIQAAMAQAGHLKSQNVQNRIAPITFSGTFSTAAPSASMATRLIANNVDAKCTAPKAAPSTQAISSRYAEHSFTLPPGPNVCLVVRFQSSCGSFDVLPAAYLGSFDPANPRSNYLGDSGAVTANSQFAINVAGGNTVKLVLSQRASAVIPCAYNLTVEEPKPLNVTLNGDFTVGTPPTTNGRLNRNGITSSCAAPKANPGVTDVGTQFQYLQHSVYNELPVPQCVVVQMQTDQAATGAALAAGYSAPLTPSDPAANYLADAGGAGTNERHYAVSIPAETDFYPVAMRTNTGNGNLRYQMRVRAAGLIDETFVGNTANFQNSVLGRLDRNGVRSVCSTQKPTLATVDAATSFEAAQHAIFNGLATPQCVVVTLHNNRPQEPIFGVAYSGVTLQPGVATNYLADAGGVGPERVYAVQVPAHSSTVLALHRISPGSFQADYVMTAKTAGLIDEVHSIDFATAPDHGTVTGIMQRTGIKSDCTGPKAFPGIFNPSGTFQVHEHAVFNGLTVPQCLSVEFAPTSGAVFAEAFLNLYTRDHQINYYGDSGANGNNQRFSLLIPPESAMVIVPTRTSTAGATDYTLRLVSDPVFADGYQ